MKKKFLATLCILSVLMSLCLSSAFAHEHPEDCECEECMITPLWGGGGGDDA